MDNPTMEELEEEARIQLKQRVHIWCKLYGLNLHSHMKQVDEHTGTRTSNIYDEIINDPSKIKFGDWLIKLLINKRSSWLLHILLRHKDISLRKHTGKCCRVYIGDYNYIDIEFVFVNDEALQNKPETNPLTTNNLINIEIGAFILDNESWEKGYNMYNVNDLFHHGTRCTDLLTIQNIISEHNNNSKTLDIYLHAQEMITTPKPLHPHLVKGNLIRFHCKPFSWNLYDTEICSITNNSNNSNTRTIVQETEVQDNVINNSTEQSQKKRKAVVAEAEDNAINNRTEQQSQKKRKANNNSIDNNIDNNPSDMTEEQENNNVDKLSLKSPPDNHTEDHHEKVLSRTNNTKDKDTGENLQIPSKPTKTQRQTSDKTPTEIQGKKVGQDEKKEVKESVKDTSTKPTMNQNDVSLELPSKVINIANSTSSVNQTDKLSLEERSSKFVKAVEHFLILLLYAAENKEYKMIKKEMDEFPDKLCFYAPFCRSHPDICKGHHKGECTKVSSRCVFIPEDEKEFDELKSTFTDLRKNFKKRRQRASAKLQGASKSTKTPEKASISTPDASLTTKKNNDDESLKLLPDDATNNNNANSKSSKKDPSDETKTPNASSKMNQNNKDESLKASPDENTTSNNNVNLKSSDNSQFDETTKPSDVSITMDQNNEDESLKAPPDDAAKNNNANLKSSDNNSSDETTKPNASSMTLIQNNDGQSLKSPPDDATNNNNANLKSSDNKSSDARKSANRATKSLEKVKNLMAKLLKAAGSRDHRFIDEEVDKFPEKLCFYAPYCSSHPDICKGHHNDECTNVVSGRVVLPDKKKFNEVKSTFADIRRNSKKRRQRASAKLKSATKSTKTPTKKTSKETPKDNDKTLSPFTKKSKQKRSNSEYEEDKIKETEQIYLTESKSTKTPQQTSKETPQDNDLELSPSTKSSKRKRSNSKNDEDKIKETVIQKQKIGSKSTKTPQQT